MTAEEWLMENQWSLCDLALTEHITHAMEGYANSKVLEALEREVPKAYETGWCDQNMGFPFEGWDSESTFETRKISYYETEVKPKYGKSN